MWHIIQTSKQHGLTHETTDAIEAWLRDSVKLSELHTTKSISKGKKSEPAS